MRIIGIISSSINTIVKAGFLYGGSGGTGANTTINKLTFKDDTYTTLSATPPVGITQGAGSANSGVAGYTYGGYESTWTNRIAKLNFTSDAVSTLSATISTATYGTSSFSDNGTAGYKTGGHQGSAFLGAVDKLTYSDETRSSTGATMGNLYLSTGLSNKGVAGYTVGGYSWSTNFVSTVYKFVFATNSVSTPTNYGLAQYNIVGWENNGTAGYSAGGGESRPSTIYKMPFSTDSMSSISATLSSGADWGGGLAEKGVAGYYALGRIDRTVTDKVLFSNDTRSTIAQTLTTRYGMMSISNTGVI